MIDTGSLTPEPATAEPREVGKLQRSPWRTKAKAAVSAWLAQWGVVVTVFTSILLFVGKCGIDIQHDRLKADFDRLGERIDSTSNTLNEKVDDISTALSRRIDGMNTALSRRIDGVNAALTQRIDGQTELLNERIDARTRLLDQKIESQSVLLTKELKRVEAQLGARIDRIESAQRQSVPATLPNRSSADGADGVRFTGPP